MADVKRFLRTNRDPGGIQRLFDKYPAHKFRLQGRRLLIDYPNGQTKQLLSDSEVAKTVQSKYKAVDHVGLTPKLYHALNKKFANVSYRKVQKLI